MNFHHVELVVHLMQDRCMWNLAGNGTFPDGTFVAIEKGLGTPYLRHALLGFSARHLAFLRPERSAHYLHLAITLQTHAVSEFNATWCGTTVDQSNCVAILGFSSVLGHHLLADTLAKRDPGGLQPFLAAYTQCAEMHRGVFSVVMTAWEMLMETEMGSILSQSRDFTSRLPEGTQCDELKQMVDETGTLTHASKDACRLAIRYLQVGFDAILSSDEKHNLRYQMLYLWSMLAPPDFISLLAAEVPEALAILAYYAALLHHGRSMWQVQDAGVYLLRLISDRLDAEQRGWLEKPLALAGLQIRHSMPIP